MILLTALSSCLWLENSSDPQVIAWADDRSAETEYYLSQLPGREAIAERLSELVDYPQYSLAVHSGEWIIFSKREGQQNQPVYYIQKGLDGESEVLMAPNGPIHMLNSSQDGSLLAYAESHKGSDWCTLKVIDLKTKEVLSDRLEWIKIPYLAWKGNGFYYSRFEKVEQKLTTLSKNQKVYYHKLGDPQAKDTLVWEDPEHPLRYFVPKTIDHEKFLVLIESEGTHGRQLHVKNLETNGPWKQLVKGFKHDPDVITAVDDEFLILTDEGASNGKLILGDKTIFPEGPYPITHVSLVEGILYITRLKNAVPEVIRVDLEGHILGNVELPGLGSIHGFLGEDGAKWLFYTFESFTEPTAIFRYDIATGKSHVFKKSEKVQSDLVVEQVFYPSGDGTQIPMFLVHKKGIEKNAPTLLYGYGGFGITLGPSYNPFRMLLLEQGGLYAVPNIRGGGEYGEAWHVAGKGLNKQNGFDDFIAAAEWLIQEGWTSKEKLAMEGGSNGGLLVGACMTQRPDLFQVALPHVGVFDMLRFHLFTIGWGWVGEYGSPDNPEDYANLLSYSPLHNVKPNTTYPYTLLFTSDHDDRVVPSHSFKFYSALKEAGAPAWLRITKDAGHGLAATPLKARLELMTDLYTFLFYHLAIHLPSE